MERYSIYSGENLSEEKYLETWKLDNETFEEKDKISKKMDIDWFEYSNRSTLVLWDNKLDELIGYITPYLLTHEFSSKYILSNRTYQDSLKKEVSSVISTLKF